MQQLYNRIEHNKYSSTSDTQLLKYLHGKTNIVEQKDLKNVKDVNKILKCNSCVIFYDHTAGDIGHWCCLTKRGEILEYFDPYGREPDPDRYIHGRPRYLYNLLIGSSYDVRYNPFDFQKGRTSTCGRHVATRIEYKDMPLSEYKQVMDNIDADALVSLNTIYM